ncbi:EF-hand calcium-binding domain-containing protein 4B [Boleophthalmus pectinirostris]|uniref:EF-hand calcium-binding domain-containing protein 4B n=1 Tax=Boleophthalmus pectinirostris TaxID=150288 RepID=UPI00242F4859|nr:EF-hand calcium-binding domain-containing protein 4B [Boleophthalmus pectinirostris]
MASCASSDARRSSVVMSKVRTAWRSQTSRDEGDGRKNGDVTGQSTILEFFQICDSENKGFITRRDMQRLNSELPLTADELENVFDTLDSDGNGYLTLDEFSSGFSEFLFGQNGSVEANMEEKNPGNGEVETVYQGQWEESLVSPDDEEEQHFTMLMESLGANHIFENPTEIRSLWAQLRRDEPHLLSNFEDFLSRVTSQLIEANQEKNEMESALKRKAATHDDEIRHLYEEMEQQIKNEKDKIVLQDYKQFLSRSQDLELQLSSKEKELEQIFQKQKRLELQCQDLHSEQHETKEENVKLKQTNEELQRELEHTSQELSLAQEQLLMLQMQSTRLHEEKEMEMYTLTEGLQRERASLLKQLDLMREMNKYLRDERDISFQKPKKSTGSLRTSSYSQSPKGSSSDVFRNEDETGAAARLGSVSSEAPRGHFQRIISIEEDHLPHLLQNCQVQSPLKECSEGEEENMDLTMSEIIPQPRDTETPMSPRGQPVGKETSLNEEGSSSPPDRLFKIIIVGNSSVGKTSLLKRFCDDCFHPDSSATVGIDYSVKTITVDNNQIALQMWDTAGQERYRSITTQFFRKADGVIVMFDITDMCSFTAVRQWLTSINEAAGDDIAIMLLGNKTDKEEERQVQTRMAERLAKECEMKFFECSASSGHNVMDSMVHMARILKEQEDRAKEKTVTLVNSPSEKKKSCC